MNKKLRIAAVGCAAFCLLATGHLPKQGALLSTPSYAASAAAVPASMHLPWGQLTDSLYRFSASGGSIPAGATVSRRLVWGERSIPTLTTPILSPYGLNDLYKPQKPQALPEGLLYQEISITTKTGKAVYYLYENGMIYTVQQDKLYYLGQNKSVTNINLRILVDHLLLEDYPDAPLTRDTFETQVFTGAQPTQTVQPPTYAETGVYQVALQLHDADGTRQTVQILSGEDKQTILGALNDSQTPLTGKHPPDTSVPTYVLVRRGDYQWTYRYVQGNYVTGYTKDGSFPTAAAGKTHTMNVQLLMAKALFSYVSL